MPTSLKGWCVHCRGPIEAAWADRAKVVTCPHCGREAAVSAALEYRQTIYPDRSQIGMGVSALSVLVLGILGYVFRRKLASLFYLIADETGGNKAAVVCLAAAGLLLVWLALWLVLPILLYTALKDLRHRTRELDESTKLCARHLARLSAPSTAVGPPDKGRDINLMPPAQEVDLTGQLRSKSPGVAPASPSGGEPAAG